MKNLYKVCWLLLSSAVVLSGCSKSDNNITPSNDGTILLSAGINNGYTATKAPGETYVGFTAKTLISLKTVGTWAGHGTSGVVTVNSTAETSAPSSNKNTLTFKTNVLYWDDFGSADPDNTTGTAQGLSIYAAAVDNLANAIDITNNNKYWEIGNNQTSGWASKDLLISNNISGTSAYKFANRTTPANLIFNHAMSKISVNLYYGKGMTADDIATGKTKTVSILNMSAKGTLDITDGSLVSLGTAETEISAHLDQTFTPLALGDKFASFSALVFPYNTFTADQNVIKIYINGNVFYVNANKMIDKIAESTTDYTLKSGNNYQFNIVVNKTDVKLDATIVDWNEVAAESVSPVILETNNRVGTVTSDDAFLTPFKLWYSNTLATGYNGGEQLLVTSPIDVTYSVANGKYSYSAMYWPNHTAGYHFRGAAYVSLDGKTKVKDAVVKTSDDSSYDYIELTSGLSTNNNLVFGTHKNSVTGNAATGATATSGNVVLTFQYMMAHLTVNLTTSTGTDKVNLGSTAADYATVKILGYKSTGVLKVGSGEIVPATTTADYEIPVSDVSGEEMSRKSFVVPQDVQALKFQVTVHNSDSSTDVYTTGFIKDIKVTENGTQKNITEWSSGYKYIYTLNVTKTAFNVSAVVKDWNTCTGSVDVPFI